MFKLAFDDGVCPCKCKRARVTGKKFAGQVFKREKDKREKIGPDGPENKVFLWVSMDNWT